jgi:hypothetical protein
MLHLLREFHQGLATVCCATRSNSSIGSKNRDLFHTKGPQ